VLRRLNPVIGAVAVLALIVVAAGLGSPFRLVETRDGLNITVPQPVAPSPLPMPIPEAAPIPTGEPGFPLGQVVIVVALLVLLLLVLYTLWQLWQNRRRRQEELFRVEDVTADTGVDPPGGVVNLPALADAVEEALRRLDEVREPRDAVVAAWVELENAAARHGWERDPAQTPTEFTAHLLAVSPAPPSDTATLRRLYQQARFAEQPVTTGQVGQARTALESIARELEKSRRQERAADQAPEPELGPGDSATGNSATGKATS